MWKAFWTDMDAKGNFRWQVGTANGKDLVAVVHGDDAKARAEMIAAAPELLAALAHIDDLCDSGMEDREELICEIARVARFEVAKAEGRSA